MQRLEVSVAVRTNIWVVRRQTVNGFLFLLIQIRKVSSSYESVSFLYKISRKGAQGQPSVHANRRYRQLAPAAL